MPTAEELWIQCLKILKMDKPLILLAPHPVYGSCQARWWARRHHVACLPLAWLGQPSSCHIWLLRSAWEGDTHHMLHRRTHHHHHRHHRRHHHCHHHHQSNIIITKPSTSNQRLLRVIFGCLSHPHMGGEGSSPLNQKIPLCYECSFECHGCCPSCIPSLALKSWSSIFHTMDLTEWCNYAFPFADAIMAHITYSAFSLHHYHNDYHHHHQLHWFVVL